MRYPHLATRLYNAPLMLTPDKAEVIERVFRAHDEGHGALLAPPANDIKPRAELAAPGFVRTEAGYYRSMGGIALIPVLGTLVQRGDSLDAMSGLTGYNRIAGMLQAAVDDPRTSAIMLEIDSPGGEANGAFDLAAKIAAANVIKPTWAAVNEQAYSAAYLLASNAGRISVPESGMVGSIGVVMMHVDQSAKDAKQGMSYTPIYAGAHKVDYSSHAPLSEEALARAQSEVDRVYGLFVNAVASGRGIDAGAVQQTEAALLHPQAAMDAGLIDAVQSFDQAMLALSEEVSYIRATGQRSAASSTTAGGNMAEQTKPTAGAPALTAEQIAERERLAAESAAASARTAGTTAGAEAERTRVAAILTHAEAAGRSALAQHLAFKTASSPEEAAALMAAAPKEVLAAPANLLAEAMARERNPKVGADAAGDGDTKPQKFATAAEIYAFRAACVENARRKLQ